MAHIDLNVKVLVFDDIMSMRHVVKRVLLEIGFTDIQDAHNGKKV